MNKGQEYDIKLVNGRKKSDETPSRQNIDIRLHFACGTRLDRIPRVVAGGRLGYIPDQATVGELGQAM